MVTLTQHFNILWVNTDVIPYTTAITILKYRLILRYTGWGDDDGEELFIATSGRWIFMLFTVIKTNNNKSILITVGPENILCTTGINY